MMTVQISQGTTHWVYPINSGVRLKAIVMGQGMCFTEQFRMIF